MSFQYLDMPAVEQGANLSTGFPATSFYTSGAGGYTQGGEGGFGLPSQFSWSKYTNVGQPINQSFAAQAVQLYP